MTRYKLNQWKVLIAEWQESGKTRKEFCQERDVTVATFSYWRTKLNRLESAHPEGEKQEGFVRYDLASFFAAGYTVEWPDGMKLCIPPGKGVHELTALILSLRNPR